MNRLPIAPERMQDQSGMTLVEVLIASTIMGLVITAMMAVVSGVVANDDATDQFRQARIFVKREIEAPGRSYSAYDALVAGNVAFPADYPGLILDVNPQSGNAGAPAGSGSVQVTDNAIAIKDLALNYKRVRVTYTWTDPDQRVQTLVLNKLITDTQ